MTHQFPDGVFPIADVEQSVRSQITPGHIQQVAEYLIRISTEIQTGNASADQDYRAFADNVTEAVDDNLMQGAAWTLAASEREQQRVAEEADWQHWLDRARAEMNRVRL